MLFIEKKNSHAKTSSEQLSISLPSFRHFLICINYYYRLKIVGNWHENFCKPFNVVVVSAVKKSPKNLWFALEPNLI